MIAAWLKQMKERRIDGDKLLADIRELLEKYAGEPEPQPPPRPSPQPAPEQKVVAQPQPRPEAKVEPPKAAAPAPPLPAANLRRRPRRGRRSSISRCSVTWQLDTAKRRYLAVAHPHSPLERRNKDHFGSG